MFNHFTRIAPPQVPSDIPETKPEPPSSPSPIKPKARTASKDVAGDPSILVPGSEGDITKLTGAEEGADPTLTHDLLNRSREGQWSKSLAYMIKSQLIEARDGGYFSSLKPAGDVPILSKALRQRKTASSTEGERTKDVKGKGRAKEDVVLEKSNVLMMYVSLLPSYQHHREVVRMVLLDGSGQGRRTTW